MDVHNPGRVGSEGLRIRIPIIAERLKGQSDCDDSLFVPVEGEIRPMAGSVEGEPVCTDFSGFPAVRAGDFYMLWIEKRQQWIGIYCREVSSHFEGDLWGREVVLDTSGPLALSEQHGQMIVDAYNVSSVVVGAQEALTTSPCALRSSCRSPLR